MPETNTIGTAFDTFTQTRLSSSVLERIWQQAYGEEYAADTRPNAFYPQSVLDAIATAAATTAKGCRVLEIGCGHGLAGRYLTERLKASRCCGVDISSGSVELAKELASRDADAKGVRSSFWVVDGADTKLEDASCALVICLDVLLYLPDKVAAMKEVYRVLSPGGIYAFTVWEQGGHNERLGVEQVTDYRPLLKAAGFEVLSYESVENWRDLQTRVLQGIVQAEDELSRETGEAVARMWLNMAKGALKEIGRRHYVLGLARRPA